MKRFLSASCALFLLLSCTQKGNLPADIVLQNAHDAVQHLQSAVFALSMHLNGQTDLIKGQWEGNADFAGEMANGGKQLQFSLNADFTNASSTNESTHITLNSDFMIAGEDEIYMRVNNLTIDPATPLLPPTLLTQLLNQWWLIGSAKKGTSAPADITPDPTYLNMQMAILKITKDRGLTEINKHTSYLYDITLDKEKLRTYLQSMYAAQGKTATEKELAFADMDAPGQIWIDSTSFVIHRITWNIASHDPANPLRAELDLSLADHNKQIIIKIPANAQPFPGSSLMPLPSLASGSTTLR